MADSGAGGAFTGGSGEDGSGFGRNWTWDARISGTCPITTNRLTGECEQEVTAPRNQTHSDENRVGPLSW